MDFCLRRVYYGMYHPFHHHSWPHPIRGHFVRNRQTACPCRGWCRQSALWASFRWWQQWQWHPHRQASSSLGQSTPNIDWATTSLSCSSSLLVSVILIILVVLPKSTLKVGVVRPPRNHTCTPPLLHGRCCHPTSSRCCCHCRRPNLPAQRSATTSIVGINIVAVVVLPTAPTYAALVPTVAVAIERRRYSLPGWGGCCPGGVWGWHCHIRHTAPPPSPLPLPPQLLMQCPSSESSSYSFWVRHD